MLFPVKLILTIQWTEASQVPEFRIGTTILISSPDYKLQNQLHHSQVRLLVASSLRLSDFQETSTIHPPW